LYSPCEKIWGVQLCASHGALAAKAAHALQLAGVDYDFIDLNVGCPLEPIYLQVSIMTDFTEIQIKKDKSLVITCIFITYRVQEVA